VTQYDRDEFAVLFLSDAGGKREVRVTALLAQARARASARCGAERRGAGAVVRIVTAGRNVT